MTFLEQTGDWQNVKAASLPWCLVRILWECKTNPYFSKLEETLHVMVFTNALQGEHFQNRCPVQLMSTTSSRPSSDPEGQGLAPNKPKNQNWCHASFIQWIFFTTAQHEYLLQKVFDCYSSGKALWKNVQMFKWSMRKNHTITHFFLGQPTVIFSVCLQLLFFPKLHHILSYD